VNHYEVLGAAVGDASGVTRERLFVDRRRWRYWSRYVPTPRRTDGRPRSAGHVDFGFFSLIARPLFLWLKWTHEHMASNWGVSIIILTVIINLALLPLRISA